MATRRDDSKLDRWRRLARGENLGLAERIARPPLRLAAAAYWCAATLRSALFDYGLRRPYESSLPVVSVGNITTGGVGKTPFVAWLADRLLERGRRVAILSRGYGRASVATGNDEAALLADRLPSVPHWQDRRRAPLARRAEAELPEHVLLLDDGFQHRQLGRRLDIVLIDATDPWGGGLTLPAGLLREPKTSLRRAEIVLLTRTELVDPAVVEGLKREIGSLAPEANVFESTFRLATPIGEENPAAVRLAFAGVGNPEGFRRTLDAAGVRVAEFIALPDHCGYEPGIRDQILKVAAEVGACRLLCTEKDMVKLRNWRLPPGILLETAKIEFHMGPDQENDLLDRVLLAINDEPRTSCGPLRQAA